MTASGTWNISMTTPMGAQAAILELVEDGAALTGTMSAAAAPDKLEITDGTVEGSSLAWKASMTAPMAMTLVFTATVDGDEISGDVALGAFGNATFSGSRG